MKGVTEDEYRQLLHLADPLGPEVAVVQGEPRDQLNDDLVHVGRAFRFLRDDPEDPLDPWVMTRISPLGKLALRLWPAVKA